MTGLLFSGGLDSTSLLFWKRPKIAFFIDYGQKSAQGEFRAVKKISKDLNVQVEQIKINCKKIGTGDLAGTSQLDLAPTIEWWPFRNQLIITLASMKAIQLGIKTLLVGSVKTDKNYKDGTRKFYSLINSLMEYQEGKILIKAPAINLTTIELIKKSKIPISILAWAHSCTNNNFSCGQCLSCKKHINIMRELGYN